jgi:glutathionylspermidine synthase
MCLELVARAIYDESYLRRLKIPEAFWPLISESWQRNEASLYGRLEGEGRHLHLAGTTENSEDAGTLAYLEDTARQAGLATTLLDIEDIGWRDDGSFVDLDERAIEFAFKLYPWEWMFQDAFGAQLIKAPTRWIEPPWKAILSNKGILPLLWESFPGHPNLLPAFFEDDPNAARLGASFVRKPIYSREGANIALISEGVTVLEQKGPYGAETECCCQSVAVMIAVIVAPAGVRSIAMTRACLVSGSLPSLHPKIPFPAAGF